MARQECNNVFSDGLMMDLNPINTPKSVLTDCLNGTYITYNGNEFVLQNDMGNYKLKNCKLPTNFIPVGVRGYADILYIVSYNPLTKDVEIGSYPAPQSIFVTEDGAKANSEDHLTAFKIEEPTRYNYIINDQKHPLFIFIEGTDQETYKLYPGDEFKIEGLDDISENFIYQHLNFYIIDEDNKLYDLDDHEVYRDDLPLENGYRKVFWETPGWLAAQYDLFVPDKFNVNLKSLNVPEFLVQKSNTETQVLTEGMSLRELKTSNMKISLDLSTQTIISDLLFQETLNNNYGKINTNAFDHLFIRYLIRCDEDYGEFIGIEGDDSTEQYTSKKIYTKPNGSTVPEGNWYYIDIPCKKHNYQDDIITAFTNSFIVWNFKQPEPEEVSKYPGKIDIVLFPIINHNTQILEYYQFATQYQFSLNNLKNSSNITIADSIYKWAADDNSCTVSFNINGPFINSSNITGRYEIYRINMFNYFGTGSNFSEFKSYSSFSVDEDNLVITTKPTDGELHAVLKYDSNKWERTKISSTELNSCFYNPKTLPNPKSNILLMAEADIPNLSLFGQNTININYNTSNKYNLILFENFIDGFETPIDKGTQTIDFSKENGIYIFRIILEQDGIELTTKELPLIPSEIFNEWFGSIDNYNIGISNTMWLSKWLDNLSINNVFCNNLKFLEKLDENDKPLAEVTIEYQLKSRQSEEWRSLTINSNGKIKLNNVPGDNQETDIFKLILESLEININDIYSFEEQINDALIFRIPYTTILNLDTDFNIKLNQLQGNLWNPLFSYTLDLKTGQENKLTYKNGDFDLSGLYMTWEIPLKSETLQSYLLQASRYWFRDISDDNIENYVLQFYATDDYITGKDRVSINGGCTIQKTKDFNTYFTITPNDSKKIDTPVLDPDRNLHNPIDSNNSYLEEIVNKFNNTNQPIMRCRFKVEGSSEGIGAYQKIVYQGEVDVRSPVQVLKRACYAPNGCPDEDANFDDAKCIAIKASNIAGTRKCLVIINWTDDNIWEDLKKMEFRYYENQPEYYNLITNYSISNDLNEPHTLTKFDALFDLQWLRTDDFIWNEFKCKDDFPELANMMIFDNTDLQLELKKTQLNQNLPLIIVTNDFSNISMVTIWDLKLIDIIKNFISTSVTNKENIEKITSSGLYIFVDNKLLNELPDSEMTPKARNIAKNITNATGINDFYYNNSTQYMIACSNADGPGRSDLTDNTPYIMYGLLERII